MLLSRRDKHAFLTARYLGDGAPRRGPTAEGAGELLRIRAEIVAEQMGGAESIDGGARACDDGSGSIESMIGTGSALEFKSGSDEHTTSPAACDTSTNTRTTGPALEFKSGSRRILVMFQAGCSKAVALA
jgi:hypothetical protein